MSSCVACGGVLTGLQTKYCSKKCKNAVSAIASQQRRGQARKKYLIELSGGGCQKCGYDRNYAALSFHHTEDKSYELNIRNLRNRTMKKVMEEFEKCELLCFNCHYEGHYPHLETSFIRQQDWPALESLILSEKSDTCVECGKELINRQRLYCSQTCADKYLWRTRHTRPKRKQHNHTHCVICEAPLTGRRKRFCSTKCKNAHHQSYEKQQARGIARKLELVDRLGGACSSCGYDHNLAALNFHHTESDEKEHMLDLRNLGNRKLASLLEELDKCVLLCGNCHTELHNPEHAIQPEPGVKTPGSHVRLER